MLKITDIKAGYGSIQILNGINMSVAKQRIVSLLGGNGTGKSTLLRTISGLITPKAGTVEFDGEIINGMQPDKIVRRGLVQVTQGKEAFINMTVEENLKVGAFVISDRKRIARNLERVYDHFPILKERRKQSSTTLSGGQLQMLCLGRGLMSEPKMLMLDEPSAALAPRVILGIFKTINQIRKSGMTVLLVEQNVRMALLLSEYGYVIRDGVIHLEGTAEKLISDDKVRLSFLGGTVAKAG